MNLGSQTTFCMDCQAVGRQETRSRDQDSIHSPGALRSQARSRIHYSPPPSLNIRTRPQRQRHPPRRHDATPDQTRPRRCEKTAHDPLKTVQDFIDERGKDHVICNECRQLDNQNNRTEAILHRNGFNLRDILI